jgi:hypothetical protein
MAAVSAAGHAYWVGRRDRRDRRRRRGVRAMLMGVADDHARALSRLAETNVIRVAGRDPDKAAVLTRDWSAPGSRPRPPSPSKTHFGPPMSCAV